MTAAQIPVPSISGTWVNFFHQDRRNDYTNPMPPADTDWRAIFEDLADIGIEKFIVMAVANEGVAVYPTRHRAVLRTPSGTPLDDLMHVADARGAGVYLSTGWATDQLDELGSEPVVRGQLQILDELADHYGSHPAFEGWYLPCEDSVAPRFSARTIAGVNRLAAAARSATPNARILISPYFPHGAVIDDAFVGALSAIDVDVVAYQDGIGCAYTTSIAAQYQRLRDAHDRVGRVEMWANVESFTWERGVANTWEDALVPAAFPRLHRQLRDATGHVDRVVSFIAQGLLQDPVMRDGAEPGAGVSLRADYLDARAGLGRWKLLERLGEIAEANLAAGARVSCEPRPVPGMFQEYRFSDGTLAATDDPLDPGWVRLTGQSVVSLDLGDVHEVGDVVVSFLHAPVLHVGQPGHISVASSHDGEAWKEVTWSAPHWPHQALDRWRDVAVLPVRTAARHLQLTMSTTELDLLVDEVIVSSEALIDPAG